MGMAILGGESGDELCEQLALVEVELSEPRALSSPPPCPRRPNQVHPPSCVQLTRLVCVL